MIAPGNSFIQLLLALAFVIASGYASGRIHQWYKHGLERDHAYREGYDQASQSMFDMVTRAVPRRAVGEATGRRAVGEATGRRAAGEATGRRAVGEAAIQPRLGGHINEPRTSRYTASDRAATPELVGASRRRIVAHPAHPMPHPTGRHSRHAA